MQIFYQSASDIINPATEMHYAILSSFKNTFFPHRHDFYEITLLLEGKQLVISNSHKLILEPGGLILIRPSDIHTRKYILPGKHINIAFPYDVVNAMFAYLGDSYPTQKLLESELPSNVMLSPFEKNFMQKRMEELYTVSTTNLQRQRMMLRTLLLDIFIRYFAPCIEHTNVSLTSRHWLYSILHEMEYPHNLSKGLPALLTLSGCSHEHLCRTFKNILNCTPTEYVNNLRLNYAANLILHTDLKIIDICYNSGFNSVSHFYHLFQKKYHSTPYQFRISKGNITF